jgi:hypothetical protein
MYTSENMKRKSPLSYKQEISYTNLISDLIITLKLNYYLVPIHANIQYYGEASLFQNLMSLPISLVLRSIYLLDCAQ